MKSHDVQQELLLLTTTSFSQRPWDRPGASNKAGKLRSSFEELEQVCRSGPLAKETLGTLPDSSMEADYSCGKYIMLKVWVRKSAAPLGPEEALSINPYLFALHIHVN